MQRRFRLRICTLAQSDPGSNQAHHQKQRDGEGGKLSSAFWIAGNHGINLFLYYPDTLKKHAGLQDEASTARTVESWDRLDRFPQRIHVLGAALRSRFTGAGATARNRLLAALPQMALECIPAAADSNRIGTDDH